jgi:predicted HicB family RNase H-like nuclease
MQSQRLVSYTVRVDRKLMDNASLAAAANDEKVAQVIRKAIRAYVEEWNKKEAAKQ